MVWKKLDQGNSVYGMKIWIEALSLATSLSFRLQPCSLLLLRICVSPNAHVECFIDAPVRKLENLSEVLAVMFNSQAPCCQALSRDPGEDILWLLLLLALDSTLLQLAHQHDSYRSLCSYVLVDETQFWVCTSQELHSSSPAGQFNNCSEVDKSKYQLWSVRYYRAKLQSNHHHQQTNIHFFTGQMPFLSPSQQCQSTEGKNITFHGLAYPKLTCGSSNFASDH